MSTFLQLCQDLQEQIGATGSISTVVSQTGENGKLVDRIAQADLEIQNLWHDWDFLSSEANTPYSQALTIGDTTYTKPSDLGVWDEESFYLDYTADTYQDLTVLDYAEWRRDFRNGTQTNDIPTRIVVDKNNDLILWPPPDSAYTLTGEYSILPAKMTGNTDVSPIPVQFHRIIVLKAKLFYAGDDEAPVIYDTAFDEYQTMMDQLESYALPDQGNRRKARGGNITVVPE